MPKHEDEELVRKHIILFKKDWNLIEEYFLRRNMGASYAIRTIIRAYFKRVEAKMQEQASTQSKPLITEEDITL